MNLVSGPVLFSGRPGSQYKGLKGEKYYEDLDARRNLYRRLEAGQVNPVTDKPLLDRTLELVQARLDQQIYKPGKVTKLLQLKRLLLAAGAELKEGSPVTK